MTILQGVKHPVPYLGLFVEGGMCAIHTADSHLMEGLSLVLLNPEQATGKTHLQDGC